MDVAVALNLVVNGDALQARPGVSVAGLLDQLGLDQRKVAVERNEELVVRSSYDTTTLRSGDRLEIVHFIGGG